MSDIRVVDASVIAAWLLPDEDSDAAEAMVAVATGEALIVPFHFPAEMANVILSAVRRGRIDEAQAARIRDAIDALPHTVDTVGPSRLRFEVPFLAQKHRLTIYDALYLDLALRLTLPLATFDEDLRRAAEAEGVEMG